MLLVSWWFLQTEPLPTPLQFLLNCGVRGKPAARLLSAKDAHCRSGFGYYRWYLRDLLLRLARRNTFDAAVSHARRLRHDGEIRVIYAIRGVCAVGFRPRHFWFPLQWIAPRIAHDCRLGHIACAASGDAACDEIRRTRDAMPLWVCKSAVYCADEHMIWMKASRVDAVGRGEAGVDAGHAADFAELTRLRRVRAKRWIVAVQRGGDGWRGREVARDDCCDSGG